MSTARQQKSNAKRIFEIRNGMYLDKTEIPGLGESTRCHYPYELKETIPDEERSRCLAEIGTGSEAEGSAINLLHNDHTPELLEALLRCLPRNTVGAPVALFKFKDDPRVLPALIEAYKQVSLDDLGNIPWAIRMIAKEKVGEILLLRFQELTVDPEVFLDDEFYNFKAGDLGFIAIEILLCDPTNLDALHIFIKLLNHPCQSNRENLIGAFVSRSAAFAGSSALPTIYQAIIEKNGSLLTPKLNEALPNTQIFAALLYKSIRKTVNRLKELLYSDDKNWFAENILWQLPPAYQPMAREVLLGYLLAEKTSLWQTQYFCERLGDLVPKGFLAKSLAKEVNKIKALLENESPSTRLSGVRLLDYLNPTLAHKLAARAVSDEPDPALQNKLKQFVRK